VDQQLMFKYTTDLEQQQNGMKLQLDDMKESLEILDSKHRFVNSQIIQLIR